MKILQRSEGTAHPTPVSTRKQKTKAKAHRASFPLNRRSTREQQLSRRKDEERTQNLTLWVVGLHLIITLESGGYCRDTKPDITYRIDPIWTQVSPVRRELGVGKVRSTS
jgi:hypothetical protein